MRLEGAHRANKIKINRLCSQQMLSEAQMNGYVVHILAIDRRDGRNSHLIADLPGNLPASGDR